MHGFVWLIPLVVLVVLALIVKTLSGDKGKGGKESPYQKEPTLFTPAERSFLGVLEQALGDEFRIMGKVRLADVLKVRPGLDGKARQTAFNRIQSKHLDFVACDPGDLSIQFAVELDDRSHDRPDRQNRDAFLDEAMTKAGLPIIRFAARKGYSVQEVRETIASRLNEGEPIVEVVEDVSPAPAKASVAEVRQVQGAPKCSACGGDMVRRKSAKGANAGNEFWGCSNYPKCRQIQAA
jgi:very-short-patch-repair endonuclease